MTPEKTDLHRCYYPISFMLIRTLEVYRRNKPSDVKAPPNTRDVELFERYKDKMFTSGLINVLEQHDFLAPLHITTWNSLCQFVEKGNGVDFQFSDQALNHSYLHAYDTASEFAGLISKYTVPMNPPMSDSISIYGVGYKEKPIKPHEKKQATEINKAGRVFVEAQKDFVVLGNRTLY
ncbi:hypothetical protein BJL83_24000 [Vibrio parahaemolyticus]|nr:hypothetical protein BJL83_24000 [Vibrio parahaemolyticus]